MSTSRVLRIVFFLLLSCRLFSTTNSPQKIQCEVVPITLFSKSSQTEYHIGQTTHPMMRSKTNTSTNWSGYSAFTSKKHPQKRSVSKVSGCWTIPKISSSPHKTYCSVWIGLDGYFNDTVEQIGTEQDFRHGKQVNYAWFSLYPAPTYEIVGFPVDIDDRISASVTYQGNDVFEMTIVNKTKNVSYTVPTSYTTASGTKRSSANWVVEAPYVDKILPLAHFSTIHFSNCFTTISNTPGAIKNASWHYDRMQMVTDELDGHYKAKTSSLSLKKNFSVTWHHK